ncbi:MAG: HAD family phosphatase [Spirochaeta sp.]|jgi:beta-phosphoglucomutase-like phosphatase (HAD superfamily)|nr:HAD family phosphatase [Spirochaeta sp.]
MQAIVFDMDGVLIDSEPLHRRVEQELFDSYGLRVAAMEHLGYLGMSSYATFLGVATAHPREWAAAGLSVDFAVDEERRRYMGALRRQGIPFVSGSVELVRAASAAGWRVAVASSAPEEQISLVLSTAGLSAVISCVISGDDVTNGKPHPEIFLTAAACLDVSPAECWVVEDSSNGVQAALSAGMRCVGFTDRSDFSDASAPSQVSAATTVATSMKEVAAAIDPTLAVP